MKKYSTSTVATLTLETSSSLTTTRKCVTSCPTSQQKKRDREQQKTAPRVLANSRLQPDYQLNRTKTCCSVVCSDHLKTSTSLALPTRYRSSANLAKRACDRMQEIEWRAVTRAMCSIMWRWRAHTLNCPRRESRLHQLYHLLHFNTKWHQATKNSLQYQHVKFQLHGWSKVYTPKLDCRKRYCQHSQCKPQTISRLEKTHTVQENSQVSRDRTKIRVTLFQS